MPHSDALDAHARERIEKITHFFKPEELEHQPLAIELFLNAESAHKRHHHAEIHIKHALLHSTTTAEGNDMYIVIDNVVDKLISMIKKEKAKQQDKMHKVKTEKQQFVA